MRLLFQSRVHSRNINKFSVRKCAYFLDESKSNDGVKPQTNFVKLIGTAFGDSKPNFKENGIISCLVQTQQSADKKITHRLSIPEHVQQQAGINNIKCGQQINIHGYLRSFPFKSSNNANEYNIIILPEEVKLNENAEKPDICRVMMTAVIKSSIFYTRNFTTFDVQQTMTGRNPRGELIEIGVQMFRIFVHDRSLRDYLIVNDIERNDEVTIHGHLDYKTTKTDDQVNQRSGAIIATKIEKV